MTPITDTRPWYKQFWPWFVIALPAAMIVISISLYYIAWRKPFEMVEPNYYNEGLAINKNLDQQRQAAQLGIQATIGLVDNHRIRVQLHSKSSLPETDVLMLQLDHPMDHSKDMALALEQKSAGIYLGELKDASSWKLLQDEKRWYVYLYARQDNEQIRWQIQGEAKSLAAGELTLDAH